MIEIYHQIPPPDARLGLLRAEGVHPEIFPPDFERLLQALLAQRQHPLSATEETIRQAVRDLLRHGRYRPTGRGKPASEYLLRSVQPSPDAPGFPRINALVDVCNYLSLRTLLPISLWDLDRAATHRFIFRRGHAGEAYRFNEGGQDIALEDLLLGCGYYPDQSPQGIPLVNPVRDSLATKTRADTRRVAACVYAPAAVVSAAALSALCETFADLLGRCGPCVETAWQIAEPGMTVRA